MTNEKQHFVWEGYGLRLHIPHNSLPDDCSHCHWKIAVSLSGNFELPEDGVPVSAVYSFTHDLGDRELRNPVTLEIQHCATDTVLSGLQFLKANTNSKKLEVIQGGSFKSGYAVLKLNHFSSFGVAWFKTLFSYIFSSFSSSPSAALPLEYFARLYYTNVEYKSFKSHFYILPNLDANFRVSIV